MGETLYFAYGSNLSFEQMARRCPQSRYVGRARLHGYQFQINERGYANVVERPGLFVEGLCYRLHPEDEARLDRAEGVPTAYVKEGKNVEFFPAQAALLGRTVTDLVRDPTPINQNKQRDQSKEGEEVLAMVYLSTRHVTPGHPWDEYIIRMEQGLQQALRLGVSSDYVENEVRPALKTGKGDRADSVTSPVSSTSRKSHKGSRLHGSPGNRKEPRRLRDSRPYEESRSTHHSEPSQDQGPEAPLVCTIENSEPSRD
ncbi:hypothetical protein EYR41_010365 [Orbilia oligospora]|uniref:gamma-glutamylcyclotransferase n=1 Tax=Orbilia oligospora TaxID=2813651 RepID=A0A8H2DSV3_ORBOL|nr:hypothetical protein EYR41_010365 [Orbilia oligospora]